MCPCSVQHTCDKILSIQVSCPVDSVQSRTVALWQREAVQLRPKF